MNPGLLFYRYRSYTPLPLLALGLVFGKPDWGSVGIGFLVCALGESLRLWGVLTAGALTRMQAAPGGDVLVTHGPYAFIRNPLYVANIMIYSGVGVMAGVAWLIVVAFCYFFLQYHFIIREEERYLAGQFGERYATYQRHVPRLVPRRSPYREPAADRTPVWRIGTNEIYRVERSTFRAIIAVTLIMSALAYFRA